MLAQMVRTAMVRLGGRARTPLRGQTLHCSFCLKSQHEVRALIAGAAGFICDECVNVCVGVLEDAGSGPVPPVQRRLRDRLHDWFACAPTHAAFGTISGFSR